MYVTINVVSLSYYKLQFYQHVILETLKRQIRNVKDKGLPLKQFSGVSLTCVCLSVSRMLLITSMTFGE